MINIILNHTNALIVSDIVLGIWQISPMEPPNFIVEPPSLIYFSNTTGTLINCQGQGHPQPNVTWLLHNDRMVTDIPSLRYLILFNKKQKNPRHYIINTFR